MRSRARWYVVALAASLALPVLPALSDSGAVATGHPGSQNGTLGPLISGTSSYVGGTYVWTDYVYDDRGADTDRIPGGDSTYPAGTEPGNAADLVQLQLGLANDGRLQIGAVLETLVKPDLPYVDVGFDTDRNSGTGAQRLSGWDPGTPLGLDYRVTLRGSTAHVGRWHGGDWVSELPDASVSLDAPGNRIHATVPLKPGRATWRAVATVGIGENLGPVYDLAFVRAEDPNTNVAYKVVDSGNQVKGQVTAGEGTSTEWQDKIQSKILAGRGDASAALASIDFAAVADGRTALAKPVKPGWETYLYYSPLNYGQGFQITEDGKRFAGPFQPYGVLFPDKAPNPTPLVVFMHGANENHLQNYVAFAKTPAGEVIQPGHFDVPAITVFALGRDPNWGTGAAEQDVLDIIGDVSARHVIDANRIVATGISAGGFGTFRMTELHPDLFAGGFSLVGADRSDLLGNLINTPIRMQNGLADPLVGVSSWNPTIQALTHSRNVDFRAYVNANRSHTHVPALGNCVLRELIERGRTTNPARVQYTIDPENEIADPVSGLHTLHTDVFWVSGMSPRDTAVTSQVKAVNLVRAVRQFSSDVSTHEYNNAVIGRDYCGRNPDVRTGDTWVERSNVVSPGRALPTSNGVELQLRNLATVGVDLAHIGVSTAKKVTVTVTGDGSTSIRLLGPWPGPVQLSRDGVTVGSVQPVGGALTFTATGTGAHSYVLTPQ